MYIKENLRMEKKRGKFPYAATGQSSGQREENYVFWFRYEISPKSLGVRQQKEV